LQGTVVISWVLMQVVFHILSVTRNKQRNELTLYNRPCWAVNSSSDVQEVQHILWNLKVQLPCPHEPPHVRSQINPFHTLPSYFFKIHFNIICPFMHRSSKLSLSFSFVHQNPMCHMSCLTYQPWFYRPKNIYWVVEIVQLLIMQVSAAF